MSYDIICHMYLLAYITVTYQQFLYETVTCIN